MPSDALPRRDFLSALAALPVAAAAASAAPSPAPRLESFDCSGVRLLPGRFHDQFMATRDVYLGLPEDNLVHGFRSAAGLPAQGKPLDGWCTKDSSVVFGQWLSGMARMSKTLGDTALRDKSIRLMEAWAQCFDKNGELHGHYPFDKFFCGVLDIHLHTGHPDALKLLRRITDTATKKLPRARQLATTAEPQSAAGGNGEWYTLSENQYRAFLATSDQQFKDFGDVWRYDEYWSRFLSSARPAPLRVHAYSHVNSFNGLPWAYAASGDERYLRMARNAHDFVSATQMFATGGFGPGERLVGYDGELGRSLEMHADTAEVPCGSWAGFKFSRAMLNHTGEARYGGWAERLLYNGIGAALPIQSSGDTFYYGDYHTGSGVRSYLWEHWPCCSGTFIQAVSDYVNLIYFRDSAGLSVNLFVPSEVTWQQAGQTLKLTQQTRFPEQDNTELTLSLSAPVACAIRFRVPAWATGAEVKVNGAPVSVETRPDTWATLNRTWQNGDRISIRLPISFRSEAIDARHPDRVAICYGPVVLVEDLRFNLGLQMQPGRHKPADLAARLQPKAGKPLHFEVKDPPGQAIRSGAFFPYWDAPAGLPYRMYHDFNLSEMA